MDRLAEIITSRSGEIFEETVRLRRHFHMHPELSFKEYETSKFICRYLDRHKVGYTKGIAGTGIIAWTDGLKKGDGNVIALRSELDALPLKEDTGLEYASTNEGIMHACGHDSHMAMLLSAMLIIKDIKTEFSGKIAFIFQPGEELAPGGAIKVMNTKAFKDLNPGLIIAQHVLPELESGMVGFRSGKYMASCDEIHISIKGRGGHAALPSKSSDQVLIGSELVAKIKKIADNYPAKEPLVIGIGRFIAEGSTNIIPSEVSIKGTVRTYDEDIRRDILDNIASLCRSTGEEYGVSVDLDIPGGYPVLVNDDEYVQRSVELAKAINGENKVVQLERRMSSEDFAHYSHEYPVVFFRTGIKSKKGSGGGLHTPGFSIDEKAMLTGLKTLSYLAVKFAAAGKTRK